MLYRKMELFEHLLRGELPNRPFRYFASIDSTQNVALRWMKEGAVTGAFVLADEQTDGRGRQGRRWHTPPGTALALSMILRPDAEQLPQVMMLAAVAIAETLAQIGCEGVGIKWPNDVLIKGRKVCGILPESIWQGTHLIGVVVGMGINIRNDLTKQALTGIATTVEGEIGKPVDRLQILIRLLDHLDYWQERFGEPALFERWRSQMVTLGKTVTVKGITGTAEDVNEDGAILIRDKHKRHTIFAGEV